jgi:hypothetical protein
MVIFCLCVCCNKKGDILFLFLSLSSLGSETLRRSTDTTSNTGSHTNHLGVDGTRDTVVLFDVELGESVLCYF